jgi:hypothetical protein
MECARRLSDAILTRNGSYGRKPVRRQLITIERNLTLRYRPHQ